MTRNAAEWRSGVLYRVFLFNDRLHLFACFTANRAVLVARRPSHRLPGPANEDIIISQRAFKEVMRGLCRGNMKQPALRPMRLLPIYHGRDVGAAQIERRSNGAYCVDFRR